MFKDMDASSYLVNNVTLLFEFYLANHKSGTPIGGQFGWGGTLLKRYQQRPKVGSDGSEIRCRVQEQKPA